MKNRYAWYIILLLLILGIAYTACKDITPEQEHLETELELKLSK